MHEELEEYILSHITPEDDYLHALYRATHLQLLYPRMASGHLQALASLMRPKRTSKSVSSGL